MSGDSNAYVPRVNEEGLLHLQSSTTFSFKTNPYIYFQIVCDTVVVCGSVWYCGSAW